MNEIIREHMEIIEIAKEAIRENGIEPTPDPIRGGTDGGNTQPQRTALPKSWNRWICLSRTNGACNGRRNGNGCPYYQEDQ